MGRTPGRGDWIAEAALGKGTRWGGKEVLSRGKSHVAGSCPEAAQKPSFTPSALPSKMPCCPGVARLFPWPPQHFCPRCRWLVPFPFSDRGSPGKRRPGKCQPLKTGFSDKLALLLYL